MSVYRDDIEVPVPHADGELWGSDLLADMLRALGYRYIALNPGSSFRGLHDSLVNRLGNTNPKILLCLHEEHAVSIAHGWAKVTGEPMAVVLHANVGLMHGSMAIYNAWCDRVPMVVFGATGPVDAQKRRPWIDWIHTARDQAAMVRPYVKWDDQPASLKASLASMARADAITRTAPQAPTYVCFDVSVQEEKLSVPQQHPDPGLYRAPEAPAPTEAQLTELEALLQAATSPVFMMGRVSRSEDDWDARVALAERFGAKVVTDIKTAAAFPTDHPLHVGPQSFFLADKPARAIAEADLIIAFDWVDPAGALRQAGAEGTLVNVTLDHQLANGWSLDHMAQPAARLHIAALPDTVIGDLVMRLGLDGSRQPPPAPRNADAPPPRTGSLSMDNFAATLAQSLASEPVTLVRLPLGWGGGSWHFRHPLDYLGYDGGAGIGSGPGMLIGAALALEEKDRIPVAVLGDGDVMMGVSAFWTAARYRIPLIAIVCNNRSYFNDEVHQERVAVTRSRPVENKTIGQAISGPDIEFAAIARAQGLEAIGPVETDLDLAAALKEALLKFRNGLPVLIDARVDPEYAEAMAKGMTETGGQKHEG
ncbi:thiamine pyrophosphate-binding protein [Microbaculum marinisediminis]|uniref:Thiamine pyrophosphate-binding protein n=1 Tax=Microbaculum marinisediminis TaxID=2931392 RepID=A0AAW5R4A8_9HYPH|nr:thiamine pyrophosphate-binding protein [Microbaculum sp. A6E488]MCT8973977.1 thiamine pyrophosphate-binding protein [Microbaculum sp. A6E488]